MKEEAEECAEDEATESEEDLEFDERIGCLSKGSWKLCGDVGEWRHR